MPTTSPTPAERPDLSQLKDIHLPEAITDWPIAYGWWLLLAFIIISVLTGLYFWQIKRKQEASKNSALQLLDRQYAQFKANDDALLFLQQSNQILKRFCLQKHPHAASLSGSSWVNFLTARLPKENHKALFNDSLKQAIGQGLYQQACQFDVHNLYQACSIWLKHNKPSDTKNETGSSHD